MSLPDVAGIVGVVLMVIAFAGVQLEKLEPREAPGLLLNVVGSALVLYSLAYAFNLAAVIMESVWFLVAAYGLAKLVLPKKR